MNFGRMENVEERMRNVGHSLKLQICTLLLM